MSLRRRDLFWQESEKGGGPGDGDTIVYAANVTRPGFIQKNLIWRSGLVQDIAFLSWTDNDRELLAGNPLLSPDGTYIIWPSVERVEGEGIGGTVTLDSTTWEVSGTLASGQTVYRSAIKGQASTTASAYIRIQPAETGSLTLMCRSNGERGYDYLKVYELDSTTSVLKSFESESSATDYTAVEFNIPDTESHFIYVEYVKDYSGDVGEDAAFVYIVLE